MSGNSILPETSTGSSESPIESEQNLYGLKLKDIRDFLYPVGSIYTVQKVQIQVRSLEGNGKDMEKEKH